MVAVTRVMAAIIGILGVICSPKLITLLRVLIVDVLFQNHIRKQDKLRWVRM